MDKALVGTWHKITTETCADQYPEVVEFLEAGVYKVDVPIGEFRYWQSGDFEIEDHSRIKIQTANDRMQGYEYSIASDGVLRFIDGSQCEVAYSRAK